MTALLVVLMFIGFVLIDLAVRQVSRRLGEARARRERAAILDEAVRLDFTAEARTLKRASVPSPAARILAVDDEPVVLDSFRRILVLEGYSVDTVESGPEALGLVQRNDYDLVFTDLKMPAMDGVEVVKAVKHLRPDVDVAVITGYGTIETAVETMQHGAVAYVQKPFTPEELAAFTREMVVKREARLALQARPTVRIVAPALAEAAPISEYCVPGGTFLSDGHAWARIEASGLIRIGIDDFARKALGSIERVALPSRGRTVRRGEPLFELSRGRSAAAILAPVSGRISEVNDALAENPTLVFESPYDRGWICLVEPADLASELASLRIGKPVVAWYQDEIDRLRKTVGPSGPNADWAAFASAFLGRETTVRA